MNLNDDVVYRCRRLGPLHQRHPGRSRSLVRHDDRFHRAITRDLDDALRETPNATLYILRADLRCVLIHDRADRDAIASQLLPTGTDMETTGPTLSTC
jgi:hypothetical protein